MNIRLLLTVFLFCFSFSSFAIRPDSINRNLKDFRYLTRFAEDNLATYPYIKKLYGREYVEQKKAIRKRLVKGQDMETAACDYVFWFFSRFDTHFIVDRRKFWQEYDRRVHPKYGDEMEYEPQPLACMVDSITYLVRIPSCSGKNPTFEWVDSVAQAFKKRDCPHLILDIRGNTGGNDAIWESFFVILADHKPDKPWNVLFRNTPANIDVLTERGMDDLAERARKSKSEFVPMAEGNEDGGMFPPAGNPVKVAVIVDSRTASAAETLVRFIKDYCYRGKIYGRDNTNGANMSGNVAPFKLPYSGITCYYPVCVDEGFAKQIEAKRPGISPDVKIPIPLPMSLKDKMDTWVVWVAGHLNASLTR